MSENSLNPQPSNVNSMSLGLRIAIGVIALLVIGGLVWQYYNKPQTSSSTVAAEVQQSSADVVTDSAIDTENDPKALFEMGNNYYKSGQLEKAVAAFQKAVEKNPNNDDAYANLGATYYALEDLASAEQAYIKAIEITPDDADFIYNLGAIYVQQAIATTPPNAEKLTLAQEKIERAISLSPEKAQPYYGLGAINQLLGNNDDAIAAFEKFLALDDGADPIATNQATQILNSLKSTPAQ